MPVRNTVRPGELDQFYNTVEAMHLRPGWLGRNVGMEREPHPKLKPYLWRWADVEPLVWKGGEMVTPGRDIERRVLRLASPGMERGTTHTMSAAIQLVLPGEVAPAHRHTPTAIRFIIKGKGSFTTVEGERCPMAPGDLILTPSWTWHDHVNQSEEPIIWLDGLDTPLVRGLEAVFYEDFPEDQQPVTKLVDDSELRYGAGALKPAWEQPSTQWSPLLHYKWERTYQALQKLAEVAASPFDDVALEYTNPANGGPVLPTMACLVQLIRPGVRTQAHRQTSSAVYYVVRGEGYSVINGQRFDWAKDDFFVVPPWAWHEHGSEAGEESVLFSIQDIPVLSALGLYREETYRDNGGHQAITSHFTGG